MLACLAQSKEIRYARVARPKEVVSKQKISCPQSQKVIRNAKQMHSRQL